MFGLKKEGPTQPFVHADTCRILQADPGVGIPWNYEGGGLWKAECVCTAEYFREPITDNRVRLDPFDPATARHFGQCEYVSETDPAVIKVLLKVTDKGDYDWSNAAPARPAGRLRTTPTASGDEQPAAAPCGAGSGGAAAGWTARARGPRPVHEFCLRQQPSVSRG